MSSSAIILLIIFVCFFLLVGFVSGSFPEILGFVVIFILVALVYYAFI